MTTSLRDQIFATDDQQSEIVKVPEWGNVEIKIIGMTGAQRDDFEGSLMVGKGKKATINTRNMRAKLVQKCALDPATDQQIFDIADVAKLGQKSGAAIDRLFSVAQRLSGISDNDMEELEGNF